MSRSRAVSCVCVVALWCSAQVLTLPLEERFAGDRLDSAWVVDVSEGNALSVQNGALEIRARAHSFAHIERPLGVDAIRVSCALKPAPSISWATSVFLYWAPGVWCQLGVIDRNGNCFYACEAAGDTPSEYDLARCGSEEWCSVAIELAEDCLRYFAGDGTLLRIAPRPAAFRGAPALIVVGKGYGRDGAGYAQPDLDNDYGDRGPMGVSMVRNLAVTALAPTRVKAAAEEIRAWEMADRDPLGAVELGADTEVSFASVARHFPPLAHTREIVGVRDHPHDIGIAEDGSLQLSDDLQAPGAPVAFFEVGDKPVRFGSRPPGCVKRLFEGYLPIVVAAWNHDGLVFEQTVCGASEGLRVDKELFAVVRLTIMNKGPAERTLPVQFRAVLGEDRPKPCAWRVVVPPNESRALYAKIFFDVAGRGLAECGAGEFNGTLARARTFWVRLLGAGARIDVPEPAVNDAYRAWLAYGFLDVDLRNDVYEPCDGAGFYEQVFGYSAALFCHALDLAGYAEDARTYLESLLRFQATDGSFIVNYGLPDMGALLFAMTQHYRLTGDADWLRKKAPNLQRMAAWLLAARKKSMQAGADVRPLSYGLIESRPYCDHGDLTYNYYADAYSCVGIEETARAFAEVGLASEAEALTGEAAAYRKDILASMDAAVIERDGSKILPMEPLTHRILKGTNYRAGGYYGLVASMLLESGFFAPGDARAALVVDFMRTKGGLILGMCEFGKGVDHAYTYGYWRECLVRAESDRREIDRVVLGFYGSLAYGMSRDTWAGVEVTQITNGDNTPTLPHLYSTTQQCRLLRMMLLREDGERLILAGAIPRAWLARGKHIDVARAPTAFGTTSYRIEARNDDWISLALTPPTRRPPRAIVLTLRLPDKGRIGDVKVKGATYEVQGDTIVLRNVSGPVTVFAKREK